MRLCACLALLALALKRVMKFLDQQATLKSQLEDEEMQWLDAQEQLEAAKDAYDISA